VTAPTQAYLTRRERWSFEPVVQVDLGALAQVRAEPALALLHVDPKLGMLSRNPLPA